MGMLADVVAEIVIRAEDLASEKLREVGAEMKLVGAEAESATVKTKALGDASAASGVKAAEGGAAGEAGMAKFKAGAGLAVVGLVAAGAASAAFALHTAADFQEAMSKVHGFAGASSSDMGYYQNAVLKASAQFGVSADQMAGGLYYVISAGFKGKAAMDVLRASTMAAAASGSNMSTVANAVTTALNAYHLSGTKAQQVTDILSRSVVEGKTTFEELATSIGRPISISYALHASLADVGAAMATLTDRGFSARLAGMNLTMVMRGMLAPTSAQQTAMEALGLSTNVVAQVQQHGLIPTLEKYYNTAVKTTPQIEQMVAAHKLTAAAAQTLAGKLELSNSKLKEVFGSAAALSVVLSLASDHFKMLNTNAQGTADAAGTTKRAWDIASEDLNTKLHILGTSLEDVAIKFGIRMLPAVTTGVGAVTSWIGKTDNAVEHNKQLQADLNGLGPAWSGAGDAINQAGVALGLTSDSTDKAHTKSKSFGDYITGSLVASLDGWAQTGRDTGNAVKSLGDATAWTADSVKTSNRQMGESINQTGVTVHSMSVNASNDFDSFQRGIFDGIGNAIGSLEHFAGATGNMVGSVAGDLGSLVGTSAARFGAWAANMIATAQRGVASFLAQVGTLPGRVGGYLGTLIGETAARLGSFVSEMASGATHAVSQFVSGFQGIVAGAVGVVQTMIGSVEGALSALAGSLLSLGAQAGQEFASGLASAVGAVAGAARSLVGGALSILHFSRNIDGVDPVELGANFGREYAQGIASTVGMVASAARQLVSALTAETAKAGFGNNLKMDPHSVQALGAGGQSDAALAQLVVTIAQWPPQFQAAGQQVIAGFGSQLTKAYDDYLGKVRAENTSEAQKLHAENTSYTQSLGKQQTTYLQQIAAENTRDADRVQSIHEKSNQQLNTFLEKHNIAIDASNQRNLLGIQQHEATVNAQRQKFVEQINSAHGKNAAAQASAAEKGLASLDAANARWVNNHAAMLGIHTKEQKAMLDAWLQNHKESLSQSLAAEKQHHAEVLGKLAQQDKNHVAGIAQAHTKHVTGITQAHQDHVKNLKQVFDSSIAKINAGIKAASTPGAQLSAIDKSTTQAVTDSFNALKLSFVTGKGNVDQLTAAYVTATTKRNQLTEEEKQAQLAGDRAMGLFGSSLADTASNLSTTYSNLTDQFVYDSMNNHGALAGTTTALIAAGQAAKDNAARVTAGTDAANRAQGDYASSVATLTAQINGPMASANAKYVYDSFNNQGALAGDTASIKALIPSQDQLTEVNRKAAEAGMGAYDANVSEAQALANSTLAAYENAKVSGVTGAGLKVLFDKAVSAAEALQTLTQIPGEIQAAITAGTPGITAAVNQTAAGNSPGGTTSAGAVPIAGPMAGTNYAGFTAPTAPATAANNNNVPLIGTNTGTGPGGPAGSSGTITGVPFVNGSSAPTGTVYYDPSTKLFVANGGFLSMDMLDNNSSIKNGGGGFYQNPGLPPGAYLSTTNAVTPEANGNGMTGPGGLQMSAWGQSPGSPPGLGGASGSTDTGSLSPALKGRLNRTMPIGPGPGSIATQPIFVQPVSVAPAQATADAAQLTALQDQLSQLQQANTTLTASNTALQTQVTNDQTQIANAQLQLQQIAELVMLSNLGIDLASVGNSDTVRPMLQQLKVARLQARG